MSGFRQNSNTKKNKKKKKKKKKKNRKKPKKALKEKLWWQAEPQIGVVSNKKRDEKEEQQQSGLLEKLLRGDLIKDWNKNLGTLKDIKEKAEHFLKTVYDKKTERYSLEEANGKKLSDDVESAELMTDLTNVKQKLGGKLPEIVSGKILASDPKMETKEIPFVNVNEKS